MHGNSPKLGRSWGTAIRKPSSTKSTINSKPSSTKSDGKAIRIQQLQSSLSNSKKSKVGVKSEGSTAYVYPVGGGNGSRVLSDYVKAATPLSASRVKRPVSVRSGSATNKARTAMNALPTATPRPRPSGVYLRIRLLL